MALSNSLASQFAKIISQPVEQKQTETTVTGTAVEYAGKIYVQLDGSDQLTPIASSTVGMKDGDRITVQIKNHSATATGNTTDPAASSDKVDGVVNDMQEVSDQITEFEIAIGDKVSVEELEAESARIDNLVSENVTIKEQLTANSADIRDLEADNVTINEKLTAAEADIDRLDATVITADVADLKYATIENLEATNADIHNLEADYGDFKQLTTDDLAAMNASITNLDAEKLDAEQAEILYANIDFANIGDAAIENFFSKSGMIEDLVVSSGTVTGELVGVTIKGDLIEGGTVVADKLVILGDDGLYYKLNTNGETVSSEQTEYNSLSGTIITAKSITAEKISVNDLVAFGATIGGFHITDDSLYSGVKSSATNTTRGVFMNDDGEFAVGDANNFVRFFKDTDGQYKLAISASQISMGGTHSLEDAITDQVDEFYQSTSPTALSGGSWSSTAPTWTQGKFIWRRTLVTYLSGATDYIPSETGVCISGNTGAKGDKGDDGDPGAPGSPGAPGKDGSDGKDGTSVTITSTSVTYQASTSGTTVPSGTWSTSIPSVAAGQYLWTKTVVNYSDGKSTTSYSVGRMGQNGNPGSPGKDGEDGESVTITKTEVTYAISEDGTTPPDSDWQEDLPEIEPGSYLWTKTVVTYSDGTSTTAYTAARQGEDGKNGDEISNFASGELIHVDDNANRRPISLKFYGNTRQNLWTNPSGTANGVTVTSNANGTITLSGTSTSTSTFYVGVHISYALKPSTVYTFSVDKALPDGFLLFVDQRTSDGVGISSSNLNSDVTTVAFTTASNMANVRMFVTVTGGTHNASGTYRVMLNEGDTAEPWCPPGLNSIDELSVVTSGKNLCKVNSKTSSGYVLVPIYNGLSPYMAGMKATVSFDVTVPESGNWNLYAYQSSGLSIDFSSNPTGAGSANPKTFSLTANQKTHISAVGEIFNNNRHETMGYSVGELMFYKSSSVSGNVSLTNIQVELGTEETDYEPYSGSETPIDLKGNSLCSLPDGTRDELTIDSSGNAVITKRVWEIDTDSSTAWTQYNTYGAFYTALEYNHGTNDDVGKFISDSYPNRSGNWGNQLYAYKSVGFSANASYLDKMFFNQAAVSPMSAKPTMRVLYQLATPQVISLGTVTLPALPEAGATVYGDTPVPATLDMSYWTLSGDKIGEVQEDTHNDVQNAQTAADNAQSTADAAQAAVNQANLMIDSINASIASLVTDENGSSLMTQTSDGWTFNIGSLQSDVENNANKINEVIGDMSQVNSLAQQTNDLANDIAEKTAYITMSQDDDGDPVMELGRQDSQFRIRITNTSIDFMEGTQAIAYITNRQLYIQSSVVTDEMKIGATSGYVWKKRGNNHMGLRWVGEDYQAL